MTISRKVRTSLIMSGISCLALTASTALARVAIGMGTSEAPSIQLVPKPQ